MYGKVEKTHRRMGMRPRIEVFSQFSPRMIGSWLWQQMPKIHRWQTEKGRGLAESRTDDEDTK